MGWKPFKGNVVGTCVSGDPTVPSTRWWNHLYLLFFVWKKVTVFRVSDELTTRYRIGYYPQMGKPMILDTLQDAKRFAVRNGREDCCFFAVGEDGNEVELMLDHITTTEDPAIGDSIPLL